MEFKEFLKQRRTELGLTQVQIADGLATHGYEMSYGRVGHWETGRNKPPLEDKKFRKALAAILRMDVNEMMTELGYVIIDDSRSKEARLAAEIVDNLPSKARELAIDYLYTLEKHFAGGQ
jgi:transcriptional regulator with XRE-family HTH domain